MPDAQTEMGAQGLFGDAYVDGLEITCAQCSSSAGPTYVRWGRVECPADSVLRYAGRAAGNFGSQGGSGSNLVCLHPAPYYKEWDGRENPGSARLFNVEYETRLKGISEWHKLQSHDVPCAVCQATGSMAVHMQPGSINCPAGWAKDYSGFVMSEGTQATHALEYLCVDEKAEAHPNSSPDKDLRAARLVPVEIKIAADTSNEVPGYTPNTELSCAVCVKPMPITLEKVTIESSNRIVKYGGTPGDRIKLSFTSSRSIEKPSVVCSSPPR